MEPDGKLWVVQVQPPRTDPALDTTFAGETGADGALVRPPYAEAVLRYARLRTAASRDALPLKPGAVPRLYGLAPLTPDLASRLADVRGEHRRRYEAVLYACHTIRHPDGREEKAPCKTINGAREATEAWMGRLKALGGGVLIDELGGVILRRDEIGDLDARDGEDVLADPIWLHAPPPGIYP